MATTDKQDARMARLPVWARDRISMLERNLEHERAKLAAGPAGSDTIADPYADAPRPLGTGPLVEFVVERHGDGGSRDYFQARLEDGYLVVRGSDGIAVHPSASNSIIVKLARS